jgi:cell fate regulator YaaT (PSP1 superfamily)
LLEGAMSRFHLVRVGAMGQVGRFAAVDAVRYPRHSRVIVRTRRGLETGSVLSEPDNGADARAFADGDLLRGMTIEDELLEARLEKHRHDAYEACATLLAEHKLPAVLMDVEHLFDGQGLFFYFLGSVPPEVESLTGRLADAYEAKVQFRKFTETLIEGCGPGCGTEEAKGQGGCDSCTSCAVASACGTKRTT